MSILDQLILNLSLLTSDRQKLYDRGFNDEVINAYKFRSCHPQNVRVIYEMIERFGNAEMAEAKLYDGVKINSQLLQENILIPYLNQSGSVIKVRPHKLGFKDDGCLVYRTYESFKKSAVCIVAESEFKALAAECFGYAAIGIPGIASMSGKNWDYFASVVESIETDEFIIMFDNEEKGDPSLVNYKKDWRKRYDTIIYAYAMCQKILQNCGRNCKIATLPREWMVDGKIDIDTALHQKRSKQNFECVVQASMPPKKYLDTAAIDKMHRPFVNRRINKFFYKSPIIVSENCLWFKDPKDKDSEMRKLTNCTINIRNVYEEIGSPDSRGVKRDIALISESGIESRLITIVAGDMASKGGFQTWLLSQGNYLFYGNDKDVTAIWEHVFASDEGNIVYLVNRCGYVPEHKFYLFKDLMIHAGSAIEPDENGIFWINEVGYKANVISENNNIPAMNVRDQFDIKLFLELLSDTVDFKNAGMAKALFAWVLAVVFMEDIVAKFKFFPILFLYGTRGSGKTTIMRWLLSFFGMPESTTSLASSSIVGIQRLLSYYSGLPVVVDDWRDDMKSRSFITMFLGVYNRQVGAKGVKRQFGIAQSDIKACLAVLGEEMISDNGLQTRCLSFYIHSERKRECYDEMEAIIQQAPSFTVDLLVNKRQKLKGQILSSIDKAIKAFKAVPEKLEQRVVFNYSILLGCYNAVMNDGKIDGELFDYLFGKIQDNQKEIVSQDKIHRFADEMMVGISERIIDRRHYKWRNDNEVIYIWVKGIVDIMNKFYHRNIDSTPILIKHFLQQVYCVGLFQEHIPASGRVPCVAIAPQELPESLRDAFMSLPQTLNMVTHYGHAN